ncbi:hypothetical protein AMTR_s00157p00022340 [Amborella trichopoda]|uniref:Uncharacterized protein n=1 Tax=Amborella trichopoda TaxID=13333 RepID=W1PKD0_AMBTC|nr:hypothetical protein AMTR_s00157p00022340 [Amborella trichopoda]
MKKFAKRKEKAEEWTGVLVPKIQKEIELQIEQSNFLHHMLYGSQVGSTRSLKIREAYQRAYSAEFHPVHDDFTLPGVIGRVVLPPKIVRLPGRPKKQRRRIEEKITRGYFCKHCNDKDHNRRLCRDPIDEAMPEICREPFDESRPRASGQGCDLHDSSEQESKD